MLPQHEDRPDVIEALQQEMGRGSAKLFDVVPTLLRTVLDEHAWELRTDKAGRPFGSFEAFVAHPLWWGLESTVDDLIAYCRNAPEVQQQIRLEMGKLPAHGEIGGGHSRDSNTTSDDRGATYALRRLKRDAPELAAQVIAGEISANAAAIQAGFRKRMVTLPADPEALAQAIARRYPGWEMRRVSHA